MTRSFDQTGWTCSHKALNIMGSLILSWHYELARGPTWQAIYMAYKPLKTCNRYLKWQKLSAPPKWYVRKIHWPVQQWTLCIKGTFSLDNNRKTNMNIEIKLDACESIPLMKTVNTHFLCFRGFLACWHSVGQAAVEINFWLLVDHDGLFIHFYKQTSVDKRQQQRK